MTTTDHQALINKHIQLERIISELQRRKGRIEMELHQYMASEKATEISHPTHIVELKESTGYDRSKFTPLLELIDLAELEESGAYIPAHQEIVDVPGGWNMTKLKPFTKRGGKIKATIEGSAYVSGVKLSITARPVNVPVCPLCNLPSTSGEVHQDCADREQMMADRE